MVYAVLLASWSTWWWVPDLRFRAHILLCDYVRTTIRRDPFPYSPRHPDALNPQGMRIICYAVGMIKVVERHLQPFTRLRLKPYILNPTCTLNRKLSIVASIFFCIAPG